MRTLMRCSATALLVTTLAASPARADLRHHVAASVGGDFALSPESSGHIYFMGAYDLTGLLPRSGRLSAMFNTDTFRARAGGFRFFDGALELAGFAGVELTFAGLLIDYFRDGVKDSERGFGASWIEAGGAAKLHPGGHSSFELELLVRRWFFSRRGSTAAALELPEDVWIVSPVLRYTFWRVDDDPSMRERHRMFPRVSGIAAGLNVGLDIRSSSKPWGARASTFTPSDTRNAPRTASAVVHQWLRGGRKLHSRVRAQIAQHAYTAAGADDLTRTRVGGTNPFVISLAGAPWAAFLADELLAAQLSAHVRVFREIEVGVLGDIAWIGDVSRTGSSDGGAMGGVGLFIDARLYGFQLDVRGGWSPTLDKTSSRGQFSVFGSLGWGWSSG